jgi:cytochrome c556
LPTGSEPYYDDHLRIDRLRILSIVDTAGGCGYQKELRGAKAMTFRVPVQVIAGVSCTLLAIVAIVWSVLWLWQTAAEIDRDPSRNRPRAQIMHRKTTAMQAISDGMIRGDLQRVEMAAKQLSSYGKAIDWYLSASAYEEHGKKFLQSVDDLISAASKRDVNSAKEAVLRLERCCIECHMVAEQSAR